jgi:predicted  nucleic acid-binding Zn-ribbon protein
MNTEVVNIKEHALNAVDQLKREIRYFDQLAEKFPDHSKGLKKHSKDCSVVASKLNNKMETGSVEVIETSMRAATVFLQEGNRLRLKLRVDLLKQQATSLELESNRWEPLKSRFRALAQECREMSLTCRDHMYSGSVAEVEEALAKASEFYEKSDRLRKIQKIERRKEKVTKLQRRIDSLYDEKYILKKKSGDMNRYAKNLKQISEHCSKGIDQLEEMIKRSSINDLDKYTRAGDNFLKSIRQKRKDLEQRFHAETIKKKTSIVIELKKPAPKTAANDAIVKNADLAEEVATDMFVVTQPIIIDVEKGEGDEPATSEAIVISAKAAGNDFNVKTTLDAEPEAILPGYRKDKPVQFSVSSEFLQQDFQSKPKHLYKAMHHSISKFARKTGHFLLLTVGTLLVVTFIVILLYLSGAGFSSVGIF